MKMRFKLKKWHYKNPTPWKIRKFADSMLASLTFASGFSILEKCDKIALFFMILGVSCKFLSNFFSESPNDNGDSKK
jgi:hypothetical protein